MAVHCDARLREEAFLGGAADALSVIRLGGMLRFGGKIGIEGNDEVLAIEERRRAIGE